MVKVPRYSRAAASAGAPISAAVHGAGTPDGPVTVTVTAAEVALLLAAS